MRSNLEFTSKFRRGRDANLGKCLKNVKIIGFFDIFLDILHKMKVNLGQERVKRGLLSVQGKKWNNFP